MEKLKRIAAIPLSGILGVVLRLRHLLYDRGLLESVTFDRPVIGVGNLNLGGAGKTPMTEYLTALLSGDYRLAILSRGYKRRTKGYREATSQSTPAEIGDEPYQIYRKWHDRIILAVDADRHHGIARLIERHNPDIILLDDAFQHRRIRPSLQILLTPFHRPFTADRLFPAGSLRDLPSRARAADMIVVTKTPAGASESEKEKIRRALAPYGKPVFFAGYRYGAPRDAEGRVCDCFGGGRLLVLTGIADPEPLYAELRRRQTAFDRIRFADHHQYSAKDIQKIKQKINKNNYRCVLTTEKDFVKLHEKLPGLCYWPVEVDMHDEHSFKKLLYESIKSEKSV